MRKDRVQNIINIKSMKTKERIVDALKRLGLQPDDDGDQVMFRYQMSNYVCFVDEDDECYMAFYIPCIYEVTEENEVVVLKAINECNLHMKTAIGQLQWIRMGSV